MSLDSLRRTLEQIDREIASLEKKSADYGKKEATAKSNAARVEKSITKNCSPSMLRSKLAQIDRYNSEALKAVNSKADVGKKIADMNKRRSDTNTHLLREETAESKKQQKNQQYMQRRYEERISSLTSQLYNSTSNIGTSNTKNLYVENDSSEYDVFLSHASEDKETIADELYNSMQEYGLKVWYDTLSITWGDSLRSKIDAGLKKSKYGIVIISNDFIKKGWTNYELDALFQREMTGGKTILPIWHNITKKEVEQFSPTLAGRKALTTALFTPREIAEELHKLFVKNSLENTEVE